MSREDAHLPLADVRDVGAAPSRDEWSHESALRPDSLDEFIGQRELLAHLRIMLGGARGRGHVSDHILFVGPPGLGKTSLANIVAREMGTKLRVTSGPVLTRPGDLAALLTDLSDGDVLFVDEIHRLPRVVEEVLYPAMEDRCLDVMIGRGPSARSLRVDLPAFTLVGATTRIGLVAAPLRDRFGFIGQLEPYDDGDLARIVQRAARLLDVEITEEAAEEVARRSRGTPRIANRLLRRVRDVAGMDGGRSVTTETAVRALDLFGIDAAGLDKTDRRLLDQLCRVFAGAPVGLSTLAHALGEEPSTVEEAYEPYLLREGFVQRTPKGRQATPRAFAHLGLTAPTPHVP